MRTAMRTWIKALWSRRMRSDAGMTTSEYAMGTRVI
ncbi:DUF4244 domain-containing protein [Streptomyces sp. 8L]|nr:DUF4244 domain-containing protein [Streptomyces sp. 8L]MCA1224379.1 DUF4244 domain-containing protein [Streptomyces sp. 8L]